jgi:hypothetical protein
VDSQHHQIFASGAVVMLPLRPDFQQVA